MQNIILSNINVSEFVNLLADEMERRQLVKPVIDPLPTPEPDTRLYGDRAAATYLGCTVLTIAKLRRTGYIPFYRYGARYYYIAQELDKALKHEARRFGELRGRRKANAR
jgi:hypothetical protein